MAPPWISVVFFVVNFYSDPSFLALFDWYLSFHGFILFLHSLTGTVNKCHCIKDRT
jgi:hypothetical protein